MSDWPSVPQQRGGEFGTPPFGAAETPPRQPEALVDDSPVPGQSPAPAGDWLPNNIDLAALKADPNTLLTEPALLFFADQKLVEDALYEAVDAKDPQALAVLQAGHEAALRKVFAPEQAASAAQQLNAKNAAELLEGLGDIAIRYAKLVVHAATEDAALTGLQSELDKAQPILDQIHAAATQGTKPGPGLLEDIQSLRALAVNYATMRAAAVQASEEQRAKAEEGTDQAKSFDDTLGEREHVLQRTIDFLLSEPDDSALPLTALSVRARAQSSLQDHWDSCEAEWSYQEDMLAVLAAGTRLLLREVALVRTALATAYDSLIDTLEADKLQHVVNGMSAFAESVQKGRARVGILSEFTGEIRAMLKYIRLNIMVAQASRTHALIQMKAIGARIKTMQALPLFQAASRSTSGPN